MKQNPDSDTGWDLYRMRKAIVETVFGPIKEWRDIRSAEISCGEPSARSSIVLSN
jgi:hypothetical protein